MIIISSIRLISSIKHIIFISSYLLFIFIYLLILLNNYLFSYLFLLFYIYLNNIILIKCNFLYHHWIIPLLNSLRMNHIYFNWFWFNLKLSLNYYWFSFQFYFWWILLKITFVLELMDRYLRTYELKAKFNWCCYFRCYIYYFIYIKNLYVLFLDYILFLFQHYLIYTIHYIFPF